MKGEKIKKNIHVTVITENISFSVYPDSIGYFTSCKYSIAFRLDGLSFMNFKKEDFQHKLKFHFENEKTKFYNLDLR